MCDLFYTAASTLYFNSFDRSTESCKFVVPCVLWFPLSCTTLLPPPPPPPSRSGGLSALQRRHQRFTTHRGATTASRPQHTRPRPTPRGLARLHVKCGGNSLKGRGKLLDSIAQRWNSTFLPKCEDLYELFKDGGGGEMQWTQWLWQKYSWPTPGHMSNSQNRPLRHFSAGSQQSVDKIQVFFQM